MILYNLLWLTPEIYSIIKADHSEEAIESRFEERIKEDNDIKGTILTAEKATFKNILGWWTARGPETWINQTGGGRFYRPLTSCIFLVQYKLFGRDFLLYNLVSMLVVVISTVLLYLVIFKISDSHFLGLLSSFWFATVFHRSFNKMIREFPTQLDLFCGLFLLSSLYFLILLIKQKRNILFGLSLFSFFLALSSKEAAIAFPLVVGVSLFFSPFEKKKKWVIFGSFFTISLFFLVYRTLAIPIGTFLGSFRFVRLFNRIILCLAHPWLGRPIWGFPTIAITLISGIIILSFFYPLFFKSRSWWYGVLPGLIVFLILIGNQFYEHWAVIFTKNMLFEVIRGVAFLVGLFIIFWRKKKEASLVLAFILAASVQLILVKEMHRIHYYYLPAIGWATFNSLIVFSFLSLVSEKWVKSKLGEQSGAVSFLSKRRYAAKQPYNK